MGSVYGLFATACAFFGVAVSSVTRSPGPAVAGAIGAGVVYGVNRHQEHTQAMLKAAETAKKVQPPIDFSHPSFQHLKPQTPFNPGKGGSHMSSALEDFSVVSSDIGYYLNMFPTGQLLVLVVLALLSIFLVLKIVRKFPPTKINR
jgi:hypothetical protein